MLFNKTKIEGLYIIEYPVLRDSRGSFSKNFQKSIFLENKLECEFSELYFTTSKRGVIRGMHFQSPPHDHEKLVSVISGKIIDVILDIRESSKTYGAYIAVELSEEDGKSVFIPRGLAHGFGVLSEYAVMQYLVTSEYSNQSDNGVLFDGFGFSWPINNPIISKRDLTFPALDKLVSPFKRAL